MASESGMIAAYFGRSLERKKKAEQTDSGPVQQQKDTSGRQGRQQTRLNVARPTPARGVLCMLAERLFSLWLTTVGLKDRSHRTRCIAVRCGAVPCGTAPQCVHCERTLRTTGLL